MEFEMPELAELQKDVDLLKMLLISVDLLIATSRRCLESEISGKNALSLENS